MSAMNNDEFAKNLQQRFDRLAEGEQPLANEQLQAFLADPSAQLADKGDLVATPASNVHGSAATQTAGPPKERWSMKHTVGVSTRRLARMGTVAKVLVAGAALTLVTAGAAGAATVAQQLTGDDSPAVVQQDPSNSVDDVTEGTDVTDTTDSGTDATTGDQGNSTSHNSDADNSDANQSDADQSDANQSDDESQGDNTQGDNAQGDDSTDAGQSADDSQGDTSQGDDSQGGGSSSGSGDSEGEGSSGQD